MSLLAEFYSTFWALEPRTLQAIQLVIERWSAGVRMSPEEIQVAIGNAPEVAADRRAASQAAGQGGVAVVPVHGVLTHRGHNAQQVSTTLTSTEILAGQIASMVRDPGVSAVVLDFDSPGGSVHGVQELGEAIFALRGEKPIVGVASPTAASGAYWAISQCDEVVVTPSGWVGSIGVILAHDDLSGAMEKAGVKREYIISGENKAEGNPTGPISDSTRAHLQGLSDTYYAAFTKAVARGRGQSVDVVRSEAWGRGRMVLAAAAVQAGMADRVDTLQNTIARLAKPQARRAAMSAASAAAHIQVLQASGNSFEA
jgi:signal peptide peptidase SppA